MRIFFVGEGTHDIGPPDMQQPRSARGVVTTLTRRIGVVVDDDSPALAWRELATFSPDAKKRGFKHKMSAAVVMSARRFQCQATIGVTDCDGEPERLQELLEGRDKGLRLVKSSHQAVCGIAIDSIEAWTLGALEAIAAVLAIDEKKIRAEYPRGIKVEALKESSGKEEHQPKALLERLAQLGNRVDDLKFREEVAEQTDIEALEKACPLGFQPFAKELRQAFGIQEPPPERPEPNA